MMLGVDAGRDQRLSEHAMTLTYSLRRAAQKQAARSGLESYRRLVKMR